VKQVADAVWSKLTGVFVNDVLHVQVRMLRTQHLVTARTTGCSMQPALEKLRNHVEAEFVTSQSSASTTHAVACRHVVIRSMCMFRNTTDPS